MKFAFGLRIVNGRPVGPMIALRMEAPIESQGGQQIMIWFLCFHIISRPIYGPITVYYITGNIIGHRNPFVVAKFVYVSTWLDGPYDLIPVSVEIKLEPAREAFANARTIIETIDISNQGQIVKFDNILASSTFGLIGDFGIVEEIDAFILRPNNIKCAQDD